MPDDLSLCNSGPVWTYDQIYQLWLANGGQPELADTMAAIALAESSGSVTACNLTPPDYSFGLWQINYIGANYPGRAARYGTPDELLADPNLQARAAIDLAAGGRGLGNWSTYTNGAYRQYLRGTAPPSGAGGGTPDGGAPGGGVARPGGEPVVSLSSFGDAMLGFWERLYHDITGVAESPVVVAKTLVTIVQWVMSPTNWLRMIEFVAGGAMMLVGGALFARALTRGEGASVSQLVTPVRRLARRGARTAGSASRRVRERPQTAPPAPS
jgi:hypothetical protein